MDVVELREFYQKPLGQTVVRRLSAELAQLTIAKPGQVVMGLGFATPYLDIYTADAVTQVAFMLAQHGVIHWPDENNSRTALVEGELLPLLESTVDVALIIHGLEFAQTPENMLAEIWRVLAPQGRLILVVPNRRGLWAASESTPFGHGQPFSRTQIATLLKDAKFSPLRWQSALHGSPSSSARFLDVVGQRTIPHFSGVTIVEAQKQVYAFSSGRKTRRLVPRFRPQLLPTPQPVRRDGE